MKVICQDADSLDHESYLPVVHLGLPSLGSLQDSRSLPLPLPMSGVSEKNPECPVSWQFNIYFSGLMFISCIRFVIHSWTLWPTLCPPPTAARAGWCAPWAAPLSMRTTSPWCFLTVSCTTDHVIWFLEGILWLPFLVDLESPLE